MAMDGKVCLVTGATSGIGRVTARELARLGAEVLLHARDPARGEATLRELGAAAPGARVRLLLADLASLAEVRRLAAAVRQATPRLDLLLHNAGAVHMHRQVTADGHELTFQVNHLAPYLLTRELLPLLRQSAPARVVTVASAAHGAVPGVDWEDLEGASRYSGWKAYGQSKLMNVLFTRELARRLAGSGVTANCLHPGVVATGFGRETRGWLRWGVRLAAPFFLTAEQGARTSLHLCTSAEVAGVSGAYFARSRVARARPAGRDDVAAHRLWELSARLVGLEP